MAQMSWKTRASHAVLVEQRGASEDGQVLRSPQRLEAYPDRLGDYLLSSAAKAPNRVFLAERQPDRMWRKLTYDAAQRSAESIGQALLDLGLGSERPVMLLSENSIDNALLQLGAMHVGIPVAPVSPAYSLVSQDHAKLRYIFDVVRPGLVYASSEERFARALGSLDMRGVELVTSDERTECGRSLQMLMKIKAGPDAQHAFAAIGHDTVAKILFTSGSTDLPKGVINTHGMLCSNQQMIGQLWPFLADRPPVMLDWLPWNHTFGGNHNFNMILRNAGTLYIDDGKPMPGAIERTLANLREVSPTVYLNVPRGFAVLLPHLEADRQLAESFFRRLDMIFSAAAALPQPLFDAILSLSRKIRGKAVFIGSGWGATETSPLVTGVNFITTRATSIGLPAPGVELKMVPNGTMFELRVRGPNVTPGYYNRDDLTQAAFDNEGFYMMGDAGRLLDPDDPSKGLVFDGRVAEDFKLTTGTWVQVGRLRVRVIEATAPLLQDAVVCGHNRDYVALLAWPDMEQCRRLAGPDADSPETVIEAPEVVHRVREALQSYNAEHKGSSTRIERVLLMTEPPDLDANEITDKGYINQRACLERRAHLVIRLFADPPDADVMVLSAS